MKTSVKRVPGKSSRLRLRGATVVLASIIVTILCFEAGLQIHRRLSFLAAARDGVKIFRKAGDRELIYEMTPGGRTIIGGIQYTINSAGFQDDEFPIAPAGRRIVVIGDSVAYGLTVPMRKAFPQILEERLAAWACQGCATPVVYNLGVAGYSTAQELRLLETRVLEYKPDLILWNYVLNDPATMDGGIARYFVPPTLELLPVFEVAIAKLMPLSDRQRRALQHKHDFYQFIHELHREEVQSHFRKLGDIAKQWNVPIDIVLSQVFVYTLDGPYPWANLNERIEELARDNGLGFVDLYELLKGYEPRQLSDDGLHPNIEGNEKIADVLLRICFGSDGTLGVARPSRGQ
jgi:lysophospholipase L1-like esterase